MFTGNLVLLYHYNAAARRQLKILYAIVLNLSLRTQYTANVNSDTVTLADGGTVVGENAYAICMDTMFYHV